MIVACMVLHNILIELKDNTAKDDAFDPHSLSDGTHDVVDDGDDNEAGDLERTMGRSRRQRYTERMYKQACSPNKRTI